MRQRIESGHALNIFAAECISPSLAGGTIVSCGTWWTVCVFLDMYDLNICPAALDGRVIANQLDETCAPCGRRLLGRHAVRANRLSLFPGSPFEFVSVGSDGIVAAYDLRERQCRRVAAALSYSLNSVDVSPLFSNHVLLCGRSPLVTLHDLRGTHPGEPIAVFCPAGLAGGRPRSEEVTVTRAVWSVAADRIAATYNDELVYVFDARASVQSKSYLDWCQSQERRAAVFAVASPAFSGGGQQRQQRSASATLSSDDTEEDAPLLRDPAPSLTAPRARSVVSSQSRRSGADSSSCAASRSHSRSPASGSGGDPEAGPPDTPGFPPVYSSASSQHSQVDSSSESSAASMRDDSIDTGDDEAAVGWVGMEELTGTDSDDSAFGSDSNDGYSDDSDADSIPGHLNLGPAMNAEEAVDARIGIDLPFACDPSRSARYYGTGAVDPSAPLGSFGTWVQRFTGHRNCDTVKGVTFMGERSEFVVSGSDCGNIFFWDAASAEVVQMIRGDRCGHEAYFA